MEGKSHKLVPKDTKAYNGIKRLHNIDSEDDDHIVCTKRSKVDQISTSCVIGN